VSAHPVAVAVLAKQPRAGFSKTRLCPPFTHGQAAALAEAMLVDTLGTVLRCPAGRRVLVLDGSPGRWLPNGFEVIPQRGEGQASRIGNAFDDLGQPAILIGMDTPQVTPELLERSCGALAAPGVDAVLGETPDGGWWVGGLKQPDARAFAGVPMSRPDTVEHQRRRFIELGLRWTELPPLTDVDKPADARAVAAAIPESRFATLLSEYQAALSKANG
jgi:glycosyltransferase A (GT-A) superfamily protein (DUF2064 family)